MVGSLLPAAQAGTQGADSAARASTSAGLHSEQLMRPCSASGGKEYEKREGDDGLEGQEVGPAMEQLIREMTNGPGHLGG